MTSAYRRCSDLVVVPLFQPASAQAGLPSSFDVVQRISNPLARCISLRPRVLFRRAARVPHC